MLSLWAPPCPIGLSVVLRNVAKPAIYPNTTPTRELYVSKQDAIKDFNEEKWQTAIYQPLKQKLCLLPRKSAESVRELFPVTDPFLAAALQCPSDFEYKVKYIWNKINKTKLT